MEEAPGGDVSFSRIIPQCQVSIKLSNDNYFVKWAVAPDSAFIEKLKQLKLGEGLFAKKFCFAARVDSNTIPSGKFESSSISQHASINLWKIFPTEWCTDTKRFCSANQKGSQRVLTMHTRVYHPENIFVEEGVVRCAAILMQRMARSFLDKNSQIHDGAMIRTCFIWAKARTWTWAQRFVAIQTVEATV